MSAALELSRKTVKNLIFNRSLTLTRCIKGGRRAPSPRQYPDTWFVYSNDNPKVNEPEKCAQNVISVLFRVQKPLSGRYLSVLVNENVAGAFVDAHFTARIRLEPWAHRRHRLQRRHRFLLRVCHWHVTRRPGAGVSMTITPKYDAVLASGARQHGCPHLL